MNILDIVNPILAVGGLGLVFGVGLGIASKKFAVPVDERVAAVRDALPGANCGGCGFAGCDAFAKAVVNGEAPSGGCPVSSDEQKTQIASIMGADAGSSKKQVAIVRCKGSRTMSKQKYDYEGVLTCEDAQLVHGGPKGCGYGCLGYGSCEKACPFDAIQIEDGLAVIDEEKCKACGVCVKICPRHLIVISDAEAKYQVMCMSQDKGKEVKAQCRVGCIGCGICVKQCEDGAITLNNQYATIDVNQCTGCGKCEAKCPTKAIVLR